MQSPHVNSGRELFVVLRDLSERFERYQKRLEVITAAPAAEVIASVNVFYQDKQDLGLLCLSFESGRYDPFNFETLIHLGTEAGLPVIDPERFSEEDRAFFYQDYLRRFSISASELTSPSAALHVLGRRLNLLPDKNRQGPSVDTMRQARRTRPITGDDQRRPVKKFARQARATRPIGESEQAHALSPHDEPTRKVDSGLLAAVSDAGEVDNDDDIVVDFRDESMDERSMAFGPAGNADIVKADIGKAALAKATIAKAAAGKAASKAPIQRSQRMATVPALPSNRPGREPLRFALPSRANPDLPVPQPSAVRKRRLSSAPLMDANDQEEPVRVRYQRGDTWMPGRLRNLTTKEIRLAASAAPPTGSTLRIAISIGERSAVLTGTVTEVVNTEGSTDGSTTFRCEFREADKQEHTRLVALLREAKKARLALTPPPARLHRRFAISWPLTVEADGRRFNASALDISEHGLFLATTTLLNAGEILFGMPLDRPNSTVRGRARVARKVSEQMARARGLNLGYGLQIDNFHVEDEQQFAEFLQRVRNRSQRHILVAGEGSRCLSLAECFHAAGYAVSKASSVEMMMERTQLESNAPDLAMMDCGSLSTEAQAHFRAAFRENGVPLLLAGEHSPTSARDRVDQMVDI